MKKTILLSLLAGTALFGVTGMKDRIKVYLSQVVNTVNESTPTATLFEVQKQQIHNAREKLAGAEQTLERFRERAERTTADLARLQATATTARARLEKLRPVLAGTTPATPCGSAFVLNGTRYTMAEVEAASRELVQTLKQAEEEAALREKQSKETRAAIAAGESALAKARGELDQAIARHREMKLQFETESARAGATEVIAGLRGELDAGVSGALATTTDELEKRITLLRQQNDDVSGASASTIVWGEEPSGSTLEKVDAALHAQAKPANGI